MDIYQLVTDRILQQLARRAQFHGDRLWTNGPPKSLDHREGISGHQHPVVEYCAASIAPLDYHRERPSAKAGTSARVNAHPRSFRNGARPRRWQNNARKPARELLRPRAVC